MLLLVEFLAELLCILSIIFASSIILLFLSYLSVSFLFSSLSRLLLACLSSDRV